MYGLCVNYIRFKRTYVDPDRKLRKEIKHATATGAETGGGIEEPLVDALGSWFQGFGDLIDGF
ncbi:hypothetical protein NO222_09830, partial [Gluconacetobacter entanii]|nr:hypothetical protein [Gluconacetobacter entanii]